MYPSIKERIQQKTPEADKVFKLAYIREIIGLWEVGEITFSRLVEILNEDAYNHYKKDNKQLTNLKNTLKYPNS